MAPSFDEIFAIRLSLQDYVMDEFTIIKRLKIILQDYNMQLDEINQYLVDFYNSFGLTFTLEEIQNINVEANSLLSLFITNGDIQMTINENNPEDNINITTLFNNIINQNIPVDEDNQENIDNEDNESNNTEQHNPNINSLPTFINDLQNIVPQNMILGPELNMFNTLINYINNLQPLVPIDQDYDDDVIVTLEQSEIDKLDKHTVTEKPEDRCTICLQDIDINDEMTTLTCKHYYHHDCIVKYLKEFDYKCPICRIEVGKSHAHL